MLKSNENQVNKLKDVRNKAEKFGHELAEFKKYGNVYQAQCNKCNKSVILIEDAETLSIPIIERCSPNIDS